MAEEKYLISGEAIFDTTKLKSGTIDAAQAVDLLADSVERSADEMNAAMRSIDDGVTSTLGTGGTFETTAVDGVDSTGGKLKDSAGEIGAEFSENLSQAFQSGDFVGATLETFASLTPALGAAGIGLGIGALMVNQILQGATEREAELRSGVNDLLSGVESEFKASMERIRADLLKGVTEIGVLEDLGGDNGLSGGLAKARELADELGLSLDQVVEVLRGRMSPQVAETLRIYEEQNKVIAKTTQGAAGAYQQERARLAPLNELTGLYELQRQKIDTAKQDAADLHDIVDDTTGPMSTNADDADRMADGMRRSAASARELSEWLRRGLDNAALLVDKANGLSF